AGSRQALAAARAMVDAVSALSAELATDLGTALRIGIGIHTGPAVVGRMGWGESFYLTAVGDTVHVAARLEQATKDYSAELVVSEAVARHAALDLSRFPAHDLTVRNRAGQITVRVIDPAAYRSTLLSDQEERIRSYRPYSRAAFIIHFTHSGSARGGSSHEVDRTNRERFPAVSMQRFTSASICALVARSKIVTSTLPI